MPYAEGSALIRLGETHVLCSATVSDRVPDHAAGRGRGWVTAEYAMLPRCSPQRVERERNGPKGRSQEIQRLIGRSLRAVTDLTALAGWQVTIDCDVLRADGSTRCASITGGFVALVQAVRGLADQGKVPRGVVRDFVTAVSVGILDGEMALDLDYRQDSKADVDLNLVLTGAGRIVEVQGTAEGAPFTPASLAAMVALGAGGCEQLRRAQAAALGISEISEI
jgi:ribonuclease PH